ncbi:hypothetical protein LEP1GSC089_0986 [Leptospira interrogans serovar Autumnalis str. LP101]|nr:hypothetical protein LEP1GSC089_0986 [Leptospira interrogans serovar Autumnalis str. LP101]EMN70337.1 hypothetical protein LEP1GSC100_1461 [Leptospira interrogans serovar Bataviae str. UI 08561]
MPTLFSSFHSSFLGDDLLIERFHFSFWRIFREKIKNLL